MITKPPFISQVGGADTCQRYGDEVATLTRLAAISVNQVKGFGGKRAAALRDAGISSVADLIHHVPRRYIDRSSQSPVAKVPIGTEVTIIGAVESVKTRWPRRNLQIIEAVVADETAKLKAVWFNQRAHPQTVGGGDRDRAIRGRGVFSGFAADESSSRRRIGRLGGDLDCGPGGSDPPYGRRRRTGSYAQSDPQRPWSLPADRGPPCPWS